MRPWKRIAFCDRVVSRHRSAVRVNAVAYGTCACRTQTFAHMRVEGTPHSWFDAQYAWDNGRMASWPDHKQPHEATSRMTVSTGFCFTA